MDYKDSCDFTYDKNLNQLKKLGLKYYPWIGKNFNSSEEKLLIIGESVYNWGSNQKEISEINTLINRYDFGRIVAYDHGIKDPFPSRKFFRNMERTILGKNLNDVKEQELLWERVIFHEFVQRPMSSRSERPTKKDYELGSEILLKIIEEFKIQKCIFSGTEWGKFISIDNFITKKITKSNFPKLNNCYPKTIEIKNNQKTKIYFIKHPSSFFSWEKWNNFMKEN